MRTFKNHIWLDNDVCPICKTQNKGDVTLLPIPGTFDGTGRGRTVEAKLYHIECLNNI